MASAKVGAGTGTEETDSEMEGWWERKDHPLLNDVILKILFEFLRGKDLKACRLVCNKWCVLTLPFTRSKFTVKLRGNDEEITKRLADFVEVFRQNKSGIPFVKYKLYPFCTTGGHGQEFLQICGNTAKIVYLMKRGIPVRTIEVQEISEILTAMPNIEVFGISHRIHARSGNEARLFPDNLSPKPTLTFLRKLVVYDTRRTKDYCPTFIEDILSVAPNVSDFKIEDSRVDSNKSRIGQALNAIEKFGRESVITNLHFENAKTEHLESLRRLAKNGLKLKKLYICPGHLGPDEKLFKFLPPLATLFKNSIENLIVEEVLSSFIELPYMPRLERLMFYISKDFDSKFVNVNKLLPSLKELELFMEGMSRNELEFLPNSEACPNVKTLSLFNIYFKIPVFDHILTIFPRLTKLELELKTDGAQILEKIMTEMTQLIELFVRGTLEGIESIDAFLTGIPVQKVKELEHVVSELKEMTVQLRVETIRHYRNRYCQFPSITTLSDLKRLHLCTDGKREDEPFTKMTDVLLYFGLYPMKHINKLKVEFCEFTSTGCEILTADLELEAWSLKDTNYHSIIPGVHF